MDEHVQIEVPTGVRAVASELHSRGHDALLVGGAVRDALRELRSTDWDLVTTAEPCEVREAVEGLPGVKAVYDLGERFGTIGVALEDGGRLEVTRFRPGALKAATAEDRFRIDAGHRDFTINAIGLDLADGRLLDPLGGRADLAAGLLRAPGDAVERFAEDPLRVLRAARFLAETGFSIEQSTRQAMSAHASGLHLVAAERIREELTKLLVSEHADAGLRVMCATGSLAAVLPEVAALDGVTQPSFHDLDVFAHTLQTVSLAPPTPVLRWAALLHDVGKAPARTVEADGRIRFFRHAQTGAAMAESICHRLRMSSADTGAIVHLVAEHMRLGDVNLDSARSVDRAVRKLDLWVGAGEGARRIVTAEDALELTMADFGSTAHREEAPGLRGQLSGVIAESRERGTRKLPRSPLSGREIMQALGLSGGEAVGVAKSAIESAIAECEIEPDDRQAALEVARGALTRWHRQGR